MDFLRRLLLLMAVLTLGLSLTLWLGGCRGGDDDDDVADDDDNGDDDDDDNEGDDYRHELTVDVPLAGDLSCLGTTLGDPTPGGTSEALIAYVLDFSEDDPINGAKMQLWANNDPTTGADFEFMDGTDHTGAITVDEGIVYPCEKFAYKVWTEWQPPETMPSYEMGNVLPPLGDPEWDNYELISVSYATYQIIPLSLAIDPDPAKGMAAGRVYGCDGEAVQNAQVIVTNEGGTKAEEVFVRYFVDELPDRDQAWTSEDGLFGAIDVPPGQWNLEIWGILDAGMPECPEPEVDGYCKIAQSQVNVIADSVNIANANMVEYPASCYDE